MTWRLPSKTIITCISSKNTELVEISINLSKNKLVLTEYEFKFYISEVIVAIESLHKANVIYRDLKPENVLLSNKGHIKLADFGFSKRLNDIYNDRTYTICGSTGYTSPEILLGSGHSYKSDIWSLGIFICEVVGGFTPFADISPHKMNSKIISGKYSLPKNIDIRMKDLIKLILVIDPELRLELTDIQTHPVFKSINWDSVRDQTIHPPYIPGEFVSEEQLIKQYSDSPLTIVHNSTRLKTNFLGDFISAKVNYELNNF